MPAQVTPPAVGRRRYVGQMDLLLLVAACHHPPPPVGAPPPAPQTGDSAATSPPGADDTAHTGAASAPSTGDTAAPPPPPRLFVFVGASDDRIHTLTLDADTGELTEVASAEAGPAPTFLALSPDLRLLYAVYSASDEVAAFTIDPATGALTPLDRVPSLGDGPTHLTIDPGGRHAFVTHYGSGTVTVLALAPDGAFDAGRHTLATGPNAHQLVRDPANPWAWVPNLGVDSVSQLVFDPVAGTLADNAVPTVSVAPGAGPRHLALHPAAPFAYLLNEHDDTLVSLAVDAGTGRLSPLHTVSTLPDGADREANHTAEVALEPTGRFLYASNRGHDSIARFSVDPASGEPTRLDTTPTGGEWPRHFSVDPTGALLVVGNQRSDTVVSFAIDPATGALTLRDSLAVPGPAYAGVVDLPSE